MTTLSLKSPLTWRVNLWKMLTTLLMNGRQLVNETKPTDNTSRKCVVVRGNSETSSKPYSRSMTSRICHKAAQILLSLALMLALIGLGGCSGAKQVEVVPTVVKTKRPPKVSVVPDPDPIKLGSVKWRVISSKRLPSGKDWVVIGVSPKDYETLAKNEAEKLRWIKEAKSRLKYYRERLR